MTLDRRRVQTQVERAEKLVTVSEAVAFQGKRRGIALIGHSLRTRDMAPFDKRSGWAIFVMNTLWRHVPRVSFAIDMHRPDELGGPDTGTDERDIEWHRTTKTPIYAQKHYDEWPSSIALPIGPRHAPAVDAEGRTTYPCPDGCDTTNLRHRFPRAVWTSTMCYMIGMSVMLIEQGQSEPRIGLWGIDLLDDYAYQGFGVAYLIAKAEAAGIEVVLPTGSGLFREPYLYGYEDHRNAARRTQLLARHAELTELKRMVEGNHSKAQEQLDEQAMMLHEVNAAITENEYEIRNITDGPPIEQAEIDIVARLAKELPQPKKSTFT